MSKSNVFENAFLLLVFNNVAITLIGDASGLLGSAAAGNLYLSGHSADPGEAGDQTTNEIAYGGYARIAVPRTSGGFTVSANTAALTVAQDFPLGSSGSGTITHVGIGTSSSGAGKLLFKGAITPNLDVGAGKTPRVNAGTVVTED